MHGDDDQIVPYADSAPLSAKLLKNGTSQDLQGLPARHADHRGRRRSTPTCWRSSGSSGRCAGSASNGCGASRRCRAPSRDARDDERATDHQRMGAGLREPRRRRRRRGSPASRRQTRPSKHARVAPGRMQHDRRQEGARGASSSRQRRGRRTTRRRRVREQAEAGEGEAGGRQRRGSNAPLSRSAGPIALLSTARPAVCWPAPASVPKSRV